MELLVGEMVDRLRSSLAAMSERVHLDPERWRVGGLSPAVLTLDAQRAAALYADLEAVVERYRDTQSAPGGDERVVEVLVAVVPGPPA